MIRIVIKEVVFSKEERINTVYEDTEMENKTILHVSNMIPPRGKALPFLAKSAPQEMSFEIAQTMVSLEDDFPEMKTMGTREKHDFLRIKMNEWQADLSENRLKRSKLDDDIAFLKLNRTVFEAISDWGKSGIRIEKPERLAFRSLRKAVAEGKTVYFAQDFYAKVPSADFEKEVFRFAEVLVIEHDWAGALSGTEILDTVVKLPYEVCAFEFKFSGRSVVAFATQFETEIVFTPAIYHDGVWMLCEFVHHLSCKQDNGGEGMLILMEIIQEQIRAACIALDAEVATSSMVREPFVSERGRNNYQPLKPYHVVSLAHRGSRPLPLAGQPTGRHVRLHFRRGHWRHFESHKTWIKWMLCGDPDLGFIDKHYKL